MSEATLLMSFIDGSESFTQGFESGQIWEKCKAGESFENYLCHRENRKQIRLIMDHFGYRGRFDNVDDTWSEINGLKEP